MKFIRTLNDNVLSSKYFSNLTTDSSIISKLKFSKQYFGKIITLDFEKLLSTVPEQYYSPSDLCLNGLKGVIIFYDVSENCVLIDFFYGNESSAFITSVFSVLHRGGHNNILIKPTGRYFSIETIENAQKLGLISDNKELEKELLTMQQITSKHRIKIKH